MFIINALYLFLFVHTFCLHIQGYNNIFYLYDVNFVVKKTQVQYKSLIMKDLVKFFIIFFNIFPIFCNFSYGQTVIEMTYPTDADLVLVKVDNKKDADIIVFKTTSKEEARQWDCMWMFKEWGFSDLSIFIMNDISDTILYIEDDYAYKVAGKIYFTDKKEERGYNDPYFRLEGIFRKFKYVPVDTLVKDTVKDQVVNQTVSQYFITLDGKLSFGHQSQKLPENLRIKLLDSSVINTVFEIMPDSNIINYKHKVNKGYYNLMITADGYKSYTEQVVISENDTAYNYHISLNMEPVVVPKQEIILIVNNILFDFDKFYLRPESKAVLDKLAGIMNGNPSVKLELIGHTDSKGSKTYNDNLSKLRSKSAVDYLIKQGVSQERLISKGNGEANPVALNKNPNGTDCLEGRKYNRRVEIKIVDENQGNVKIEDIVVPEQYRLKDNRR